MSEVETRPLVPRLILLLSFGLTGCPSTYLVDQPLHIRSYFTGPQARQLSTMALILALERKQWRIQGADTAAGLVRAGYCRFNGYCLSVDARVAANGDVAITRTPGQYVGRDGGRYLQRWMRNLGQAYIVARDTPVPRLQAALAARKFPPFREGAPGEKGRKSEKERT